MTTADALEGLGLACVGLALLMAVFAAVRHWRTRPEPCHMEETPAAPGGAPATEVPLETDHWSLTGAHQVHDHPLPRWLRIAGLVYGLVLVAVGGTVIAIMLREEAHDRAVTRSILRTIDERTEQRDKEAAQVQRQLDAQEAAAEKQSAATRAAVCALLANDFEPSPTVVSVGQALNCQPPITLTP